MKANEIKNRNDTIKALVVVTSCISVVVGVWFYMDLAQRHSPKIEILKFTPQYRVPLEQMVLLSDAMETYTKKNGKRPATLDDLVAAKLIEQKTLFDPTRKSIPATGGPYDVIYNPAVLPGDTKDCVILYTIFLSRQDEPFYAIHNDYTISKFKPRELVKALNDTYRVIGEDIQKKQSAATQPAIRP